jgi:hypothetical protein
MFTILNLFKEPISACSPFGSHYEPFISAIIFAMAAAIVVFLWDPKTLMRHRFA